MRASFLVFSVLAAVPLVYGQPKPCATPQMWQGILFEIDPSKTYDRLADIFYDAIDERIAIKERVKEGQERDHFYEIFLYQKNVVYRINIKTGVCSNSTLSTPFRRIEVPRNATYYGTFYVGSTTIPLAGFKVNSFGGDTENGRYVGSWTSFDCIPVTDAYIGSQAGFVHWSFYNVVLGIEDPDVFIPPPECYKTVF